MSSNDFEIVGYQRVPRRPEPPTLPPPSDKPRWIFRGLFIVITLLALLISVIIIDHATRERGSEDSSRDEVDDIGAPSGLDQEAEAPPSPEGADARPEDSVHESPDEIDPHTESPASGVSSRQRADERVISAILNEQEGAPRRDDNVYRRIAVTQYNLCRLIHHQAQSLGVNVTYLNGIRPVSVNNFTGPYYFGNTIANGRVILDLSRLILEASGSPDDLINEQMSRYPDHPLEEFTDALFTVPIILAQSTLFFVGDITHNNRQRANMLIHRMKNRTGHILSQSEENYSALVSFLHELTVAGSDRKTQQTAQVIRATHQNQITGRSDPLSLIAAHMDAVVMYVGQLLTL